MLMPPRKLRFTALIVLPEMVEPGEPKMTIPPSVASVMVLPVTVESAQERLMPSALHRQAVSAGQWSGLSGLPLSRGVRSGLCQDLRNLDRQPKVIAPAPHDRDKLTP